MYVDRLLEDKDIEINRLRIALGFYANEDNWFGEHHLPKNEFMTEVGENGWDIAKKALEEV